MLAYRNSRLLPAGHLIIDVWMLALLVWHTQEAYRHIRRSRVRPVFFQEAGAPGWDFRHVYVPPPDELVFLGAGNLPAMAVSLTVGARNEYFQYGTLWEVEWFLFHEAISLPLWCFIGSLIDADRLPIKRLMRLFQFSREGLALPAILPVIARLGGLLEMLFWWALILWGIVWSLILATRKARELLHDRHRSKL